MKLRWEPITLELKTTFRVAHGATDRRNNVLVYLDEGVGEAAMVPYYGETQEGIIEYLQSVPDLGDDASDPVWMPDSIGLVVSIVRDEKVQIVLTDREGSWPRRLVDAPGDVWNVRPSPDGRYLLFTHRPLDDLNRLDIWLVEVESGQIRELTNTPKRRNWGAVWSPDGGQIAFISERSGFNEVWLVEPDGSNERQVSQVGADIADLEWSPDGSQIACTVNRQGAFELAILSVDTGELRTLRQGKGFHAWPQWSPDGDFLTFEYESPLLPPDLYRVELAGGRMTQLRYCSMAA
jgi:Tol biopolymer transport system component